MTAINNQREFMQLRSGHLKAMINYCLQQANDSGINIMDFGDNNQALDLDDTTAVLQSLQQAASNLTDDSFLLVQDTDDHIFKLFKAGE